MIIFQNISLFSFLPILKYFTQLFYLVRGHCYSVHNKVGIGIVVFINLFSVCQSYVYVNIDWEYIPKSKLLLVLIASLGSYLRMSPSYLLAITFNFFLPLAKKVNVVNHVWLLVTAERSEGLFNQFWINICCNDQATTIKFHSKIVLLLFWLFLEPTAYFA